MYHGALSCSRSEANALQTDASFDHPPASPAEALVSHWFSSPALVSCRSEVLYVSAGFVGFLLPELTEKDPKIWERRSNSTWKVRAEGARCLACSACWKVISGVRGWDV